MKIIHRINKLRSIEHQNLLNWSTLFQETSRICKWNEKTQREILTQIIDLNIKYQIGASSSSEELLKKILALKYNQNRAHKFQRIINNIKQKDFFTLGAYMKEIDIQCRKLALCLVWSEDIVVLKKVKYSSVDWKRLSTFKSKGTRIVHIAT
ncbi:hypothetical protein DMUE_0277 [Dictyocoela muelleri]|nr:hypothetical protein DMUE_0277 [Dictyocoela muelleri]